MPSALLSDLVEPAYHTGPTYPRTLGDEVADLCTAIDYAPDEEQRLVLNDVFGMQADGKSSAFEYGLVASRQNLKTGVFKMCALGWLFVSEINLIIWSAHEFDTAREAHRDLAALIDGSDELRPRLKAVNFGNGNEKIELLTGQRILFKARTKTGGRGLSGDRVVLDEAFHLHSDHMGALMPTLSVRPDPQLVYGSSAPLAHSDVLRALMKRGRAGTSKRLAYAEWSAPREACEMDGCTHAAGEVTGCALDRVANWKKANPLLGRTRANGTGLTVEYVQAEREALPPHEFARERLGWGDEPGAADAFGQGKWEACLGPLPPKTLPVTGLAVAVSYDLRFAAIVAAGIDTAGVAHVVPLRHGPGTGWVAEAAKEIVDAYDTVSEVAIDGGGPAADLITPLENAGVPLRKLKTPDVLDACAGIYKRVQDQLLQHATYEELEDAASAAVQRPVGDRWAWGRKQSGADISTLEGATFAVLVADTAKPKRRSVYEERGLETVGV
jgi:hypothetical protein